MKPNINALDRLIRLIIGVVGVLLIATGMVSGPFLYITGAIALIMFITAFLKFCPIYRLLGVTTCRK